MQDREGKILLFKVLAVFVVVLFINCLMADIYEKGNKEKPTGQLSSMPLHVAEEMAVVILYRDEISDTAIVANFTDVEIGEIIYNKDKSLKLKIIDKSTSTLECFIEEGNAEVGMSGMKFFLEERLIGTLSSVSEDGKKVKLIRGLNKQN